ncbi:unnamed protein product [Schistosoma rodhaini]|nr:unnamed protein product [Schistosoma rodhaini]
MTSNNPRRPILPKTRSTISVVDHKKPTPGVDSTPLTSTPSSSSSSFKTIAPKSNQDHTVIITPEVVKGNESNEDVVLYCDIESSSQDFNPLRNYRAIYANNVVPRSYLRVMHQRVLLPSHTIPRTPINTDILPSGPSSSGFNVDKKGSPRPVVKFLLRIGSALVRSQYEPAVGKEVTPHQLLLSNRRKRRRVDEEPTRLSTDKVNIETINISHLEWKPKMRHPRWEDIWNYCNHCRCPYVPTSALELLRHLERGHQKLININSTVIPKKTRLEKVDCNDCMLNAAELLGNKLISRFFIPLTVNIFDSSSNISPYTCFVCGQVNKSQRLLESHFQRMHPQLTPGRIEKSTVILCSICGFPTQTNLTRHSSHHLHSDISIHISCKSNPSIHNSAPWSGCDAHALACLMLYPTMYSRFGLPIHVAHFLYALIQRMLMARINQFGGWSSQSYTLRCCAAISAIYGELVDPGQCKPLIQSKMRILEHNNSLKSVFPKASIPSTVSFYNSTPAQIRTCNSKSAIPISLSTVLVSSSLPTQQYFASSSSSGVNLTNISSVCILPNSSSVTSVSDLASKSVTGSILPSILVSQPTTIPTVSVKYALPLESMPPVCVTINKQPNLFMHGNTQIPAATTSWPVLSSSNPTLLSFLSSNQSKISIQPKPVIPVSVGLASDNLLQQQSSLNNNRHNTIRVQLGLNGQVRQSLGSQPRSLPRVLPMLEVPCELCPSNIPTETNIQSFHVMSRHRVKGLRHIPAIPCRLCGQLFWTKAGVIRHQHVGCAFCGEKALCNSTYYLHEIIKHPQDFASRLKKGAYNCPQCCRVFSDMVSFIIHLQTVHFFTVPDEISNHLCKYDSTKNNQINFNNLPMSSKLTNLSTLYSSLCMSTIPVSYSLPDNITVYMKPEEIPCWKCSVCSTHFITINHLDLHMAQASHQYWCPVCPYACERAISLWKHYCSIHNKESEPNQIPATNKLYRIVKTQSVGTTNFSTSITATSTTLSSPSSSLSKITAAKIITSPLKRGNQRCAIGHLSQFHGCDLCPVFCLTVDDLNTHKKTAHANEMLKENSNNNNNNSKQPVVSNTSGFLTTISTSITTTTTTTTTAIITSALGNQPIRLTTTTSSPSSSSAKFINPHDGGVSGDIVCDVINSSTLTVSSHSNESRLSLNRSVKSITGEQLIFEKSLSTIAINNDDGNTETDVTMETNSSNNHQMIDQITIIDDNNDNNDTHDNRNEINKGLNTVEHDNVGNDEDEDVVCPMCEFHSKLRSDVMQHIMDCH